MSQTGAGSSSLTPSQYAELATRLETSFRAIAPAGPQLIDRFYAKLFANYPQVRPMFPADMTNQKRKLLGSLALVIENLRKPEQLRPALAEMGQRHVSYGTQPEHYPIVRDCMLAAMAEVAGPAWNAQLEADWRTALNMVSELMLAGARQPAAAV